MALLFEIVKNPELAERAAEDGDDADSSDHELLVPDPDSAFPVEIQSLRQRALAVDARDLALRINTDCRPVLDDLALEFVERCLEAGPAAAETAQRGPLDLRDPRYQFLLRVCSVPLIIGGWETVVRGRESAIAAAAELAARGYAGPVHRFARDGHAWTLSIKFGF